ncbi:hypothetical protein RGQ21_68170 [Kitasatospora aureofaciens]|nr:hypothetical protein RGQ21_68170 [Kitasatospora aureofaciens]
MQGLLSPGQEHCSDGGHRVSQEEWLEHWLTNAPDVAEETLDKILDLYELERG